MAQVHEGSLNQLCRTMRLFFTFLLREGERVPARHRLLAALVAVIWGLNFLAIHASLAQFPPFFLVALRFALIAVPTVLFVPRPRVRLRWLIGYGLGFGVAQFTFLYWGMAAGMPTGLASLVLQASAPFTLALGAVLLRERVRPAQWAGIAIAVAGMLLVVPLGPRRPASGLSCWCSPADWAGPSATWPAGRPSPTTHCT